MESNLLHGLPPLIKMLMLENWKMIFKYHMQLMAEVIVKFVISLNYIKKSAQIKNWKPIETIKIGDMHKTYGLSWWSTTIKWVMICDFIISAWLLLLGTCTSHSTLRQSDLWVKTLNWTLFYLHNLDAFINYWQKLYLKELNMCLVLEILIQTLKNWGFIFTKNSKQSKLSSFWFKKKLKHNS